MKNTTGIRLNKIFRRTDLCIAMSALLCPPVVLAAPLNGNVTSGSASIGTVGKVTTINQSSNKATIEWKNFGIKTGETVQFTSAADAITLNRVIGSERSVIDGTLKADGRVFLVNANGVVFGKGAQVDTGGLVASALDIKDADFDAGKFEFNGNNKGGTVSNNGTITSKDKDGYVALLGRTAENTGKITAKGGVTLAAGEKIMLSIDGNNLLNVVVDEGTLKALAKNSGAIEADGAQVYLSARAAGALMDSQVNNTGVIQARTLDQLRGKIVLNAHNGNVSAGGTLDASAPVKGDGGSITTAGGKVAVTSGGVTTASAKGAIGTWEVQSNSFTVGSDVSGANFGTMLDKNNVSVTTQAGNQQTGDTAINSAVKWSSNTALTLNAANNINISAPLTATGAQASVALKSGGDYRFDMSKGGALTLEGAQATLKIQGLDYTLIRSMAELVAIDDAGAIAAGRYALVNNLVAPDAAYSKSPIARLSGTVTGLGHTIDKLKIVAAPDIPSDPIPSSSLITRVDAGAQVRDIRLSNIDYQGETLAGLVLENRGKVSNAHTTGKINGTYSIGGLVGRNIGAVADSSAKVDINAISNFGGLVSRNDGSIDRSFASGNLTATAKNSTLGTIGGLVGANTGNIAFSYATGNIVVDAENNGGPIGGLAGSNAVSKVNTGNITDSYATGNITATNAIYLGGLVGTTSDGTIARTSASGNINLVWNQDRSGSDVGGLVGRNQGTAISYSKASGNINITVKNKAYYFYNVGGLVGENAGGKNWGSVDHSSASGNIVAENGMTVAGLVGLNRGGPAGGGTITNSSASGNVSAYSHAAGFVADNYGSVRNGDASGNVQTVKGTSGSFVASNYKSGVIVDSVASGNASGSDTVGGIAGSNSGLIKDTKGSGSAGGDGPNTGGPVGLNDGITQGISYYDAPAEARAAAQAAADAAAKAAAIAAADAAAKAAATAAAADAAAKAAADAASKAIADAGAAKAASDTAAQAIAETAAAAAAAEAVQTANNAAAAQAASEQVAQQARTAAATQTSSAIAAEAQGSAVRRARAVESLGGTIRPAAATADAIVFMDKRSFSTSIRQVEVDGVVFDLENDKPN